MVLSYQWALIFRTLGQVARTAECLVLRRVARFLEPPIEVTGRAPHLTAVLGSTPLNVVDSEQLGMNHMTTRTVTSTAVGSYSLSSQRLSYCIDYIPNLLAVSLHIPTGTGEPLCLPPLGMCRPERNLRCLLPLLVTRDQ